MFNKNLEKAFIINITELQITVNFTDLKMSVINYKALEEAHIINTVEL